MKNAKTNLISRDYFLVSFIAISFSIFIIPIIKNIASIKITFAIIIAEIIILLILANLALWIASLLAKKIPIILQLAKFVAVGVFNTFLNWGVVNLLMFLTQIFEGALYTFYIIIAFIIANFASFFWNKYWVFPKDKKSQDSAEKDYLQFLFVSVIGLLIQAGIATAWVGFVPTTSSAPLWANIGLILGTVFSMVWNFLGYKFIVFKK
jgi:putative flippase GtrA